MSRARYVRKRNPKKENKPSVVIPNETTLNDPTVKRVVKISERPLLKLNQLREDIDKLSTAFDDYLADTINALEKKKPIDLADIKAFMLKATQTLQRIAARVPETEKNILTAIQQFEQRVQLALKELAAFTAEKKLASHSPRAVMS